MPRALWKGAISFGLVHIPVELYPATQRHTLDLDMLDRRSMSPIGYKKVNKSSGKEVAAADIVKGFQYEKGRYVVLGEEDFRRANVRATQTVEIIAFIRREEIPLLYYDTPYYLAPGKRGEKVYALLRETMRKAGRVALATVVIQTRQHLAVVIAEERMLVLYTLRYQDEIRDAGQLELPAAGARAAGLNPKELEMALKLIENMSGSWKPSDYHDSYRDDLMKRVKEKIKAGKTDEVTEPEKQSAPRSAQVIDLMALLKDSVSKGKRTAPARAGNQKSSARRAAKQRKRA